MMLKTVLPCLLAASFIAGCGRSRTSADVVEAAAVSTAPAPVTPIAGNELIDGVYRGRATPINQSGRCGPYRDPTLRIRNNRIVRRFGNNRLEATVQPDGTFYAYTGTTRMSGTVRDGHLDAEIGGEHCRYRYSLRRS
jgi:hypothetical protein